MSDKKKLKEESSWKVFFFKSEDDYEGYLFVSGIDATDSARAFCKHYSPTESVRLEKVNKAGVKYVADDSEVYALVMPPEFSFAREFFI